MTTQTQTAAAHDAVSEVEAQVPAVNFSDALKFVPSEFHDRTGSTKRDRFVRSVVANAQAVGRSAYTVALFALDFA